MRIINHYPDPNNQRYYYAEIEIKNHQFDEIVTIRFNGRNKSLDETSKDIVQQFGLKPSQVMVLLRNFIK